MIEGGYAFPVADLESAEPSTVDQGRAMARGMSLRDYTAIEAMKALLTGHLSHYGHENHWPWDHVASEAYDLADAMLKARKT